MCRGGGVSGWFLPSGRRPCFVGSLRGARARGRVGRVAHCATSAVAFSWDLERYGRVDWMGGRSNKVDPGLLFFFFCHFETWLLKSPPLRANLKIRSSG